MLPCSDALNAITLHPRLLGAAAQLLGGDSDIRIYNAHTMFKTPEPNGRSGSSTKTHGEQPDFAFGEQGLHQEQVTSEPCLLSL